MVRTNYLNYNLFEFVSLCIFYVELSFVDFFFLVYVSSSHQ